MSRRDDERIARARTQLLALLGEQGHLLPGGLVERMMRCGKPGCRCNATPPQLHGPYHQWGYSKRAHRYTRRLSEVQVERYGPAIERGRRFMELLAELDDAEGWAA